MKIVTIIVSGTRKKYRTDKTDWLDAFNEAVELFGEPTSVVIINGTRY